LEEEEGVEQAHLLVGVVELHLVQGEGAEHSPEKEKHLLQEWGGVGSQQQGVEEALPHVQEEEGSFLEGAGLECFLKGMGSYQGVWHGG
jgi:hypothetical protein